MRTIDFTLRVKKIETVATGSIIVTLYDNSSIKIPASHTTINGHEEFFGEVPSNPEQSPGRWCTLRGKVCVFIVEEKPLSWLQQRS